MGFNEKTVRKYHDKFLEYKGKFVDEESGKYKKQCLMNDENFHLQVSMWVRENASQKGEVNTSAKNFCEGLIVACYPTLIFHQICLAPSN